MTIPNEVAMNIKKALIPYFKMIHEGCGNSGQQPHVIKQELGAFGEIGIFVTPDHLSNDVIYSISIHSKKSSWDNVERLRNVVENAQQQLKDLTEGLEDDQ